MDSRRQRPRAETNILSRRRMIKFGCGAAAAGLLACVEATSANAGYGRCYKCACPGYEGNDPVCSNCGHSYGDHW